MKRRLLMSAALACALLALCVQAAGAVPLEHYDLDTHVDVGLTNPAGVMYAVPHMIASILWSIDRLLVDVTLAIFDHAFTLDLLIDPRTGLLAAASATARTMHASVATPLLEAALLAGAIAHIVTGLMQRRYTELAGRVLVTIAFTALAFAVIHRPEATIAPVARASADISAGLVRAAVPRHGVSSAREALWRVLVEDPYAMLNFGGRARCVNADGTAVSPASYTHNGTPLPPRGARCTDAQPYAKRFLAHPPGSQQRDEVFEQLKSGSPLEQRLVDIQQKQGAYQRIALASAVLIASAGALVCIALLALGIVAWQLVALLLIAVTPLALLSALLPGAGHTLFVRWAAQLGLALLRKLVYSLKLALLLGIAVQLSAHTQSLGAMTSWTIQAALWWGMLIYGRRLGPSFSAPSPPRHALALARSAASPAGAALHLARRRAA